MDQRWLAGDRRIVARGRHITLTLVNRLRPSNIDSSAKAVGEVAHTVGQIRTRWPMKRAFYCAVEPAGALTLWRRIWRCHVTA